MGRSTRFSRLTVVLSLSFAGLLAPGRSAGAGDGLVRRYTVADGLPGNEVTCVLPRADGTVWVGARQGLAVLGADHNGRIRRLPAPAQARPAGGGTSAGAAPAPGSAADGKTAPAEEITALVETADRTVIVSTRGGGLRFHVDPAPGREEEQAHLVTAERNHLRSNTVLAVVTSRNYLLVVTDAGADWVSRRDLEPDGDLTGWPVAALSGRAGAVLAASPDGEVYAAWGREVFPVSPSGGPAAPLGLAVGGDITALAFLTPEILWVGTARGVEAHSLHSFARLDWRLGWARDREFDTRAICCDADGRVWFGDRRLGAAVWFGGALSDLRGAPDLPRAGVNQIAAGPGGVIWIAAEDGLYRVAPPAVKPSATIDDKAELRQTFSQTGSAAARVLRPEGGFVSWRLRSPLFKTTSEFSFPMRRDAIEVRGLPPLAPVEGEAAAEEGRDSSGYRLEVVGYDRFFHSDPAKMDSVEISPPGQEKPLRPAVLERCESGGRREVEAAITDEDALGNPRAAALLLARALAAESAATPDLVSHEVLAALAERSPALLDETIRRSRAAFPGPRQEEFVRWWATRISTVPALVRHAALSGIPEIRATAVEKTAALDDGAGRAEIVAACLDDAEPEVRRLGLAVVRARELRDFSGHVMRLIGDAEPDLGVRRSAQETAVGLLDMTRRFGETLDLLVAAPKGDLVERAAAAARQMAPEQVRDLIVKRYDAAAADAAPASASPSPKGGAPADGAARARGARAALLALMISIGDEWFFPRLLTAARGGAADEQAALMAYVDRAERPGASFLRLEIWKNAADPKVLAAALEGERERVAASADWRALVRGKLPLLLRSPDTAPLALDWLEGLRPAPAQAPAAANSTTPTTARVVDADAVKLLIEAAAGDDPRVHLRALRLLGDHALLAAETDLALKAAASRGPQARAWAYRAAAIEAPSRAAVEQARARLGSGPGRDEVEQTEYLFAAALALPAVPDEGAREALAREVLQQTGPLDFEENPVGAALALPRLRAGAYAFLWRKLAPRELAAESRAAPGAARADGLDRLAGAALRVARGLSNGEWTGEAETDARRVLRDFFAAQPAHVSTAEVVAALNPRAVARDAFRNLCANLRPGEWGQAARSGAAPAVGDASLRKMPEAVAAFLRRLLLEDSGTAAETLNLWADGKLREEQGSPGVESPGDHFRADELAAFLRAAGAAGAPALAHARREEGRPLLRKLALEHRRAFGSPEDLLAAADDLPPYVEKAAPAPGTREGDEFAGRERQKRDQRQAEIDLLRDALTSRLREMNLLRLRFLFARATPAGKRVIVEIARRLPASAQATISEECLASEESVPLRPGEKVSPRPVPATFREWHFQDASPNARPVGYWPARRAESRRARPASEAAASAGGPAAASGGAAAQKVTPSPDEAFANEIDLAVAREGLEADDPELLRVMESRLLAGDLPERWDLADVVRRLRGRKDFVAARIALDGLRRCRLAAGEVQPEKGEKVEPRHKNLSASDRSALVGIIVRSGLREATPLCEEIARRGAADPWYVDAVRHLLRVEAGRLSTAADAVLELRAEDFTALPEADLAEIVTLYGPVAPAKSLREVLQMLKALDPYWRDEGGAPPLDRVAARRVRRFVRVLRATLGERVKATSNLDRLRAETGGQESLSRMIYLLDLLRGTPERLAEAEDEGRKLDARHRPYLVCALAMMEGEAPRKALRALVEKSRGAQGLQTAAAVELLLVGDAALLAREKEGPSLLGALLEDIRGMEEERRAVARALIFLRVTDAAAFAAAHFPSGFSFGDDRGEIDPAIETFDAKLRHAEALVDLALEENDPREALRLADLELDAIHRAAASGDAAPFVRRAIERRRRATTMLREPDRAAADLPRLETLDFPAGSAALLDARLAELGEVAALGGAASLPPARPVERAVAALADPARADHTRILAARLLALELRAARLVARMGHASLADFVVAAPAEGARVEEMDGIADEALAIAAAAAPEGPEPLSRPFPTAEHARLHLRARLLATMAAFNRGRGPATRLLESLFRETLALRDYGLLVPPAARQPAAPPYAAAVEGAAETMRILLASLPLAAEGVTTLADSQVAELVTSRYAFRPAPGAPPGRPETRGGLWRAAALCAEGHAHSRARARSQAGVSFAAAGAAAEEAAKERWEMSRAAPPAGLLSVTHEWTPLFTLPGGPSARAGHRAVESAAPFPTQAAGVALALVAPGSASADGRAVPSTFTDLGEPAFVPSGAGGAPAVAKPGVPTAPPAPAAGPATPASQRKLPGWVWVVVAVGGVAFLFILFRVFARKGGGPPPPPGSGGRTGAPSSRLPVGGAGGGGSGASGSTRRPPAGSSRGPGGSGSGGPSRSPMTDEPRRGESSSTGAGGRGVTGGSGGGGSGGGGASPTTGRAGNLLKLPEQRGNQPSSARRAATPDAEKSRAAPGATEPGSGTSPPVARPGSGQAPAPTGEAAPAKTASETTSAGKASTGESGQPSGR